MFSWLVTFSTESAGTLLFGYSPDSQPDTAAFSAQLHSSGSYTQHGSWNELVEGDVNLPVMML